MKIEDYEYRMNEDALEIARRLQNGPIIVTLNGRCEWGYSGGILSSADFDGEGDDVFVSRRNGGFDCNAVDIGHAVAAVGIKNVLDPTDNIEKPCLIIQNSWGTDHGEEGFEYILIEDAPGFGGIF